MYPKLLLCAQAGKQMVMGKDKLLIFFLMGKEYKQVIHKRSMEMDCKFVTNKK